MEADCLEDPDFSNLLYSSYLGNVDLSTFEGVREWGCVPGMGRLSVSDALHPPTPARPPYSRAQPPDSHEGDRDISPGLSPPPPRPGAAHSLPTPPSLDLGGFSSSDEDLPLCDVQGKCCASCNTRKTPLWRDAEDGTPLCNACGIRYKKYRVRCAQCWHIPKKDGNSFLRCLKCGNFLRLSLYQRKNGHR